MNIARDCVWRLRAMLTQRKAADGGLMTKNGGYPTGESAGKRKNGKECCFSHKYIRDDPNKFPGRRKEACLPLFAV